MGDEVMALSQTERNKRWQAKNKEKAAYMRKRSVARTFITKYGKYEDLLELKELLDKRLSE
ncbi:hypothetical protein FC32_GL002009 [Ligilactobacillus apodemi DSM 16634 = JCM 16172]|uniref:Uncharacterized protein n=1 Tax=Ligilactobacillus apodemi DSM 16634 = JCM 16172 TaxID=1423724 RepID=A0A0R1TY49_9LACO|nr:hypothetical protein FC32_GL002009 [Ligilactobacillus apodemi DSM 16634 = JCM 16172]